MTSVAPIMAREYAAWLKLIESATVRKQQVAFTGVTELPLTLVPATAGGGGSDAAQASGAFCIEGCLGGRSGELCQRILGGAERRAAQNSEPVQFRCPVGLLKIIVSVFVGGRHVGNLLAGPFSQRSLDRGTLRRLTHRLQQWGLEKRVATLRASWRYSPLLSSERSRSAATLLEMFAQYLSERGNQLLADEPEQASPLLKKIEAYLAANQNRSVSTKELAQRVHLSPCYFCKLFKKQTGLTFTEYRRRARVVKAKRLLLDPHRRVSEVAFDAGFDSIPYFNRVFRRFVGCSPSEYRAAVPRTTEDKRLTI
ncbi:MAG: helix-turn-helix domain-containing protein [Deltaproteobacteria bacterium]|nr:helix-turn-helix domain-containing protein [Deltaproteobacteria bacterium]